MDPLVSISWLSKHLNDKELIILDASLPSISEKNESINSTDSIPGARFFDIKVKFSDTENPFPNALPSPEQFELECQNLGINRDSKIVVFDNKGVYSSPRVWWMFKTMGHDNIFVLNGGLPLWIKEGLPTQPINESSYSKGNFEANLDQQYVKSYEDVLDNIANKSFTIVDARAQDRFEGTASEPRKNLQSGHIPNSVNLHFKSVLEDGKFKSKSELQKLFLSQNLKTGPLVFSCGSGITACIIMLAYEIAFTKSRNLFDGSWTEWATRQKLIVNQA